MYTGKVVHFEQTVRRNVCQVLPTGAGDVEEARGGCRHAGAVGGQTAGLAARADEEPGPHHGGAVQVEPTKSMLKAPGTKRLKLNYDILISSFAFSFNLRRYTTVDLDALVSRLKTTSSMIHEEGR